MWVVCSLVSLSLTVLAFDHPPVRLADSLQPWPYKEVAVCIFVLRWLLLLLLPVRPSCPLFRRGGGYARKERENKGIGSTAGPARQWCASVSVIFLHPMFGWPAHCVCVTVASNSDWELYNGYASLTFFFYSCVHLFMFLSFVSSSLMRIRFFFFFFLQFSCCFFLFDFFAAFLYSRRRADGETRLDFCLGPSFDAKLNFGMVNLSGIREKKKTNKQTNRLFFNFSFDSNRGVLLQHL